MKVGIVGLAIGSLSGDPQKTLLGNPMRSWALYKGLRQYGIETELFVDPNATIELDPAEPNDGLVREPVEFVRRIRDSYDYTVVCGTRIQTTFDQQPWLREVDCGKLILAQCYHNDPAPVPEQFVRRVIAALFVSPRYIRAWQEEYPVSYTSLLTTGSPPREGEPQRPSGDVVFVGHIHSSAGLRTMVETARRTPEAHFHIVSSRIRKPGITWGEYVLMEQEPEGSRAQKFKEILQGFNLEQPSNLSYHHLPPGMEDSVLEHASVGLDVAWSEHWLIDNSKVNYYLGYGIPVITQPPSLSHRFVEATRAGEVLPLKATPEDWSEAVRRWRTWTLEQKVALRRWSAQAFDWNGVAFDVYNAILQDQCAVAEASAAKQSAAAALTSKQANGTNTPGWTWEWGRAWKRFRAILPSSS